MNSAETREPEARREVAAVERDLQIPEDWMRDAACGKRFAALQHVFTRLPDDDYNILRRKNFYYWWTGPHNPKGAIILAKEETLFFFLNDGLEALSQEYANYTVAHEIAHVVLRHPGRPDPEREREAHERVRSWGFKIPSEMSDEPAT